MRRREFIAGLGGTVAWPAAVLAQQPAIPVVGILTPQSLDGSKIIVAPFLRGLKETGFVDRQNVAIDYHFAENQPDRLPALAADLVRRRVAAIVTGGNAAALAAKAATTTIPIVFTVGSDPVTMGLVASLNRPEGNATGRYNLAGALGPKQLQLLRELMPKATLIGLLGADGFVESDRRDLQVAARTLGLQLLILKAGTDDELEKAFVTLTQQQASAIIVVASTFFNRRIEQLVALAARYTLPAIYSVREYALAGGLMSYGTSIGEGWRQVGIFVGRILNGAKPADLPVEQLTRIDLTLNLKTAKALRLEIPTGLLVRADEVIE
jgi:putative tryptophan/tyrosine transport system substrate-binding protein